MTHDCETWTIRGRQLQALGEEDVFPPNNTESDLCFDYSWSRREREDETMDWYGLGSVIVVKRERRDWRLVKEKDDSISYACGVVHYI